ncbi:hypothetical protein CPC08DRAFT_814687 [Agrocybe pediades]|nr:hypothetical protein CPC08DRAFT_814687 [Agrocybe pediades]
MTIKRKDSASNVSSQHPHKKLKEALSPDAEFQVVNANLTLSIPPVFATNPRAGVEEMLDSMIMRYSHALQGVVLSHSNLKFVDKVAQVLGDCPFLICKIAFDATVWSPRVGSSLSGKVNLCSPDHVSLLVHRTFNVSIPRHHIPADTWEFEYGPAENDPEFSKTTEREEVENVVENDGQEIDHSSGGKWVHRVTGERLGDKEGLLEFTVIGLTVANEMLSLLGSLQPDPFSERHRVLKEKGEEVGGSEGESEGESESGESESESE